MASENTLQVHEGVNPTIQNDLNDLSAKIVVMKAAIQSVRDARKKLHDDTEAWVRNNIRKSLEVEKPEVEPVNPGN